MSPWLVPVLMGLGVLSGTAGALLGLGGGIFLMPALVAGFGLPYPLARGVSLMTVVATSSIVGATGAGRELVNVRLGMLLQVAAVAGGLTAGFTSRLASDRALTIGFGLLTLTVAFVMLTRLDRRNVSLDPAFDPGRYGARFHERESGQVVAYRVRRLPLALVIAFLGGNVSSLLGLGGGIVMVPALNAWCGVPMRAAAATSTLMIGVTAAAALPLYYAHGDIDARLAGAAVLGVLAGSRVGLRLVVGLRARVLKSLMIATLLAVTAAMLARGLL